MWDKVASRLNQFPNAVLTGIDVDGYPFSMRCTPRVDKAHQLLEIRPVGEVRIQPGPAGLLYHSHNEQLWDLKSIQILGQLERVEQGWVFHPEQFAAGGSFLGLFGQMRWIMDARANADRYLRKRGVPRPKVNWGAFNTLKAETKKSK